MAGKEREPITVDEDGVPTFDLASDEGNDDWLRTARLLNEGKQEEADELFDTVSVDEEE